MTRIIKDKSSILIFFIKKTNLYILYVYNKNIFSNTDIVGFHLILSKCELEKYEVHEVACAFNIF